MYGEITPIQYEILKLLYLRDEVYGLELVRSSKIIKRGTVYVYLHCLEEKGYIVSRQEEKNPKAIGLPRRIYQLTESGTKVFMINHNLLLNVFNRFSYLFPV